VTSTYVPATGVWSASGPIANVNVLLSGVSYVPALNFNANFSIFTSVTDGSSTVNGAKPMLAVAVNDAPVLDVSRSPVLSAENEDGGAPSGAVGSLVQSLVDFAAPAGQVDNVTDPDSGAVLGIAITGADTTHGTWFFSLNNGSSWGPLGPVSDSGARLLAANATNRLYFQPAAHFNGTLGSALTIRAWDAFSGTNGGMAPATPNGGTTAFSAASDTVALTIQPARVGRVPDGTTGSPLTVSRNGADPARIDLHWAASCGAAGTDFAVYQGTIGVWYDHAPMICSTSGALTATVSPAAGNHYYLVVAVSSTKEGSYGTSSSGLEIPAGAAPCQAIQDLAACP